MSHEEERTLALKGIGVSPGIVIGKAYLFDRFDARISFYHLTDQDAVTREIRRFRKAVKDTERQLQELKNKLKDLGGMEPIYIMDVYLLILKDKKFIETTIEHIRSKGVNAEWALRITIDMYREIFDRMEDDYFKSRISDINYVGQEIFRNLSGREEQISTSTYPEIVLVAKELSPADTARIKIDKILGFATDFGGRTSHTAIIAQSLGIPAVVGLEKITREVRTDDTVIVDGTSGVVIVNPDPEMLRRYEGKRKFYEELKEISLSQARLPAVTIDQHRVAIGGNIEFVEEVPAALQHGAENIGLYRTEFIYINKDKLPTEEEHLMHYKSVVGVPNLAWTTIRTFDLGGEKFFSDPNLGREMNPQMGLRAIRFCLREVELFKVQLRAIVRASKLGKVRLLFPMVSSIEELRQAKDIFEEVREEVSRREGEAGTRDIEIGVMIEVPSAAIIADALAREVDFFSIGTNDLIQYVLAIDRVNERVTHLYEPLHPAVLRLIDHVVKSGHNAGIKVAMCGEMAAEPIYTLILLGLEIDELSMTPSAIPRVKKIIRRATLQEAKDLLKEVMRFSSAAEIRRHVENYMSNRFPEEFSSN